MASMIERGRRAVTTLRDQLQERRCRKADKVDATGAIGLLSEDVRSEQLYRQRCNALGFGPPGTWNAEDRIKADLRAEWDQDLRKRLRSAIKSAQREPDSAVAEGRWFKFLDSEQEPRLELRLRHPVSSSGLDDQYEVRILDHAMDKRGRREPYAIAEILEYVLPSTPGAGAQINFWYRDGWYPVAYEWTVDSARDAVLVLLESAKRPDRSYQVQVVPAEETVK